MFAAAGACTVNWPLPAVKARRRYLKVEPLVIGENAKLGIELRIDNPAEAGADRLVNAIGAFVEHGGPLIVVAPLNRYGGE